MHTHTHTHTQTRNLVPWMFEEVAREKESVLQKHNMHTHTKCTHTHTHTCTHTDTQPGALDV